MDLKPVPPRIAMESPQEMFRELVEEAADRQRLDSTEDSLAYLVHLLGDFVRPGARFLGAGAHPDQPLAELFLAGIRSTGHQRLVRLRLTGDVALFLSGFFADQLAYMPRRSEYYVRLGGAAYGTIAHEHSRTSALFGELAENFVAFADVLEEVSESCSVTSEIDLLRLYEKWRQTRSRRTAERLRAMGILPVADEGPEQVH